MKLALCLLVLAAASFGQALSNAVQPDRLIQHAVDGTLRATLDPSMPNINFLRPKLPSAVASASSACVVPLRKVQIPNDTRFTIRQTPPPPGVHDHMPAAQTMPVCPAR